jgi:exopolysaccharide production protein ExoQ
MAAAIRSMTIPATRSLASLVSTWVLMIPLLVFASQWGFSFEHGSKNSAVGASAQDSGGGAPLKVQSAVVYLTCAIFIVGFARAILVDLCSDLLISSLPALAFLSIFWSQFPLVTLVHALMLAANVAFAFYLLERFSTNDLMKLLLMAGLLALIGSLLLIALLPRYGIQERSSITAGAWQGIFAQKNTCGLMMTNLLLPAFFVQIESKHARVLRNTYIAAVLLLIVMSRSAGAWVICAACILFVVTMRALVRMPRKDLAIIVFILAGVSTLAGVFIYKNFDALMYAIGKDPTLTGRTIIWSSLMISIRKQPLLGYGYTAFWGFLKGESANAVLAFHGPLGYAENGVIQLWLELGAVGVGLYMLIFFRAIKDAAYCLLRKPSPAVMWYTSGLFYITVSNLEAGQLLSTSDLGLILSLVAFAGLRREAQRTRLRMKSEEPNERLALARPPRLSGASC